MAHATECSTHQSDSVEIFLPIQQGAEEREKNQHRVHTHTRNKHERKEDINTCVGGKGAVDIFGATLLEFHRQGLVRYSVAAANGRDTHISSPVVVIY